MQLGKYVILIKCLICFGIASFVNFSKHLISIMYSTFLSNTVQGAHSPIKMTESLIHCQAYLAAKLRIFDVNETN